MAICGDENRVEKGRRRGLPRLPPSLKPGEAERSPSKSPAWRCPSSLLLSGRRSSPRRRGEASDLQVSILLQVTMYESELEQSREQMVEEMQNMEEDKNRAIEEAFAQAQLEMKAVHENLAGV